MFEFWREATDTSVPGLLCQSGRRRPENVSILSSLFIKDGASTANKRDTKIQTTYVKARGGGRRGGVLRYKKDGGAHRQILRTPPTVYQNLVFRHVPNSFPIHP